MRYKHTDMVDLERCLKKAEGYRRKLIITDSVFSMDGDLAPLPVIVELKEKYRAVLMIDEAQLFRGWVLVSFLSSRAMMLCF